MGAEVTKAPCTRSQRESDEPNGGLGTSSSPSTHRPREARTHPWMKMTTQPGRAYCEPVSVRRLMRPFRFAIVFVWSARSVSPAKPGEHGTFPGRAFQRKQRPHRKDAASETLELDQIGIVRVADARQ